MTDRRVASSSRDPAPFVGRGAALDHLRAALRVARGGRFAGVLVAGPAGMGKTRLVDEFRARVGPRVGRVLVGACLDEGGAFMPLHPITQALDALDGDVLLVPDVVADQEHHFRTLAASLPRGAGPGRVLVLVVEDLHWADATTLAFLRFLAHDLADEPVLLVGTHRGGDQVAPVLRRFLTALDRVPHVSRLSLEPLPRDDVARLVHDRVGARLDDATLDRLVTRADGITLFVEELADELARGGEQVVPARLRDVFLTLVDGLDGGTCELLDLAAVCGPEFSHDLLLRTADVPAPTVEKRAEELVDAGVLVTGRPGDDYRFRHALLHETVRDRLHPGTRRRLHAACARVLDDSPGLAPRGTSAASERARHWAAAGRPGPALVATLAAADGAAARHAHAEALRLELAAVDLWHRAPAETTAGVSLPGLLGRAAASADRTGDHARAADLYRRAIGETEPDDPVLADTWAELLRVQYLAGDLAGAVEAAVAGSASVAGRGTSGSVASLLAFAAPFVAQPGEDILAVHARTEHALDMARAVGDPAVVCDVLVCHGLALARIGRVGEARAALAEAERLATGATDPRRVLRPAVFELAMLHAAGASAEVAALGRRTLDRARELGVELAVGQQARTLVADALVSLGEWDEAAEVVEDGLAWGDEPLAGALLLVARIELALRRGRLVEAARDLETARGLMPAGHYRLERVEAELAWLRRDRPASRAHAARALAMGGIVASDDEIGSLADALVRATSAEDLERDDGIPHPDELQERLARGAGQPVVDAWRATVAARALGQSAGAGAAWARARHAWRGLGRAPMLAVASWHEGVSRLAAGEQDLAGAALSEAEAIAERLDAVSLLVEVRATVASAGAAEQPAGDERVGLEGDPPAGWLGGSAGTVEVSSSDEFVDGLADDLADLLTTREAEVLSLVALGWTNKRVGEELGIGHRTVATHLSRVLAKLEVSSRGEATVVAHRAGMVGEPPEA